MVACEAERKDRTHVKVCRMRKHVIDEAWSTAAFEFWKASLQAEEQKAYSNILSKCDQFQAAEDLSEVLWRIGVIRAKYARAFGWVLGPLRQGAEPKFAYFADLSLTAATLRAKGLPIPCRFVGDWGSWRGRVG